MHTASSPSSLNAETALEKAVKRFGKDITVVNGSGSGSENMDKAEYCAALGVSIPHSAECPKGSENGRLP